MNTKPLSQNLRAVPLRIILNNIFDLVHHQRHEREVRQGEENATPVPSRGIQAAKLLALQGDIGNGCAHSHCM